MTRHLEAAAAEEGEEYEEGGAGGGDLRVCVRGLAFVYKCTSYVGHYVQLKTNTSLSISITCLSRRRQHIHLTKIDLFLKSFSYLSRLSC